MVATSLFSKGEILWDYHGKVLPAAEGRAMMEGIIGKPGYMFFFKDGDRDMCINAPTFPCGPMNHS